MLKKILFVSGGSALLLGLVFGRDAFSYVGTSIARVHHSVRDNVPVEFEIERARNMIKDLVPEIRHNMHLIAKEEVQVEQLGAQVAQLESRLDRSREELLTLKTDLDSGRDYFHYAGHRYTSDQVKNDLSSRFARFKTNDATRVQLTKVLAARQKSMAAARQKLEGMLAAKQQLELDIENLEARLKMVEVAQATSEFNFDDSHLARTKSLLTDIQTRIEVAERLVNSETTFDYEIPLDAPEVEDVSDEITAYFSSPKRHSEELAEVNGIQLK